MEDNGHAVGAVAELPAVLPEKPPGFDPVTEKDVLKVISDEHIPVGAMLVHLLKALRPADKGYIDKTIVETEEYLRALKTVRQMFPAENTTAPEKKRSPLLGRKLGPRKKKAKHEPHPDSDEPIEGEFIGKTAAELMPKGGAAKPGDPDYTPNKKRGRPPKYTSTTSKASPSTVDASQSVIVSDRRMRVAEVLLKGPKRPMELCTMLGIPSGSITHTLNHPWFVTTSQGAMLTPEGRSAADPD